MRTRVFTAAVAAVLSGIPAMAMAQSRPLMTQDPEPVKPGEMLIDFGASYSRDAVYPLSGLTGNLVRAGTFDLSFGVGPVAEIQLSGGVHDILWITQRDPSAPLAGSLTVTGGITDDFADASIGAKVRLLHQKGARPSLGIRFTTRLPNEKHDSGLGLDTTDFAFGFVSGKTMNRWRVIGNVGFAILQDPVRDGIQNDVVTFGVAITRAMGGFDLAVDANGRADPRRTIPVGTEPRSTLLVGIRVPKHIVRYDASVAFGLTSHDPRWTIGGGVTWVWHAFDVK